MNKLQLVQTRKSVTHGGSPRLMVESTVIHKGPLPTAKIFVNFVQNPLIPSHDTLVRVANVADLNEIGDSREQVIHEGDTFMYRSSMSRQYYQTVDVAKVAAQLIKDRVDDLVNSYETFSTDFAGSFTTEHPRVDPQVLALSVEKLMEAKKDREAAAEARDEAAKAVSDMEAQLEFAMEFCQTLEDISKDGLQWSEFIENEVNALIEGVSNGLGVLGTPLGGTFPNSNFAGRLHTAFGTLNAAGDWAKGLSGGDPLSSYFPAVNVYLTNVRNHLEAPLQQIEEAFKNISSNETLLAASAECSGNKATLEAQLVQAKKQYAVKQAELEAAQLVEDNALGEIVAMCPTFSL